MFRANSNPIGGGKAERRQHQIFRQRRILIFQSESWGLLANINIICCVICESGSSVKREMLVEMFRLRLADERIDGRREGQNVIESKHWTTWIEAQWIHKQCLTWNFASFNIWNGINIVFAGQCEDGAPCEHSCFNLHDTMYECYCYDGFYLHSNGYNCIGRSFFYLSLWY